MDEKGNVILFDDEKTLKDILPPEGKPVYVLFVGKFPLKESIDAGHYYQGQMGQQLWEMLIRYGIIEFNVDYFLHRKFEDDDLPKYGYGMTDIIKKPGYSGMSLMSFAPDDISKGYERIKRLIEERNIKIVVFLFKEVLEAILRNKDFVHNCDIIERGFDKSNYKEFFNNAEVFVFPGMGFQKNEKEERAIMEQLKDKIDELKKEKEGI